MNHLVHGHLGLTPVEASSALQSVAYRAVQAAEIRQNVRAENVARETNVEGTVLFMMPIVRYDAT